MSLTVERVLLGKLRPYPGNARRGDLDSIADSLRVNGQYSPLVVQRSTGYVLVGNQRLQAAQRLHWPAVDVTYLDVDDAAARRIVLADNRTSDLGGYDDRALADLLGQLAGELDGTGYEPEDLTDLLAALAEAEGAEPTVLIPADRAPSSTDRRSPTLDEYEAAFPHAARFLPLTYPRAQYAWVVEKADKVAADRGLTSPSDLFLNLLAETVGEVPPPPDADVPEAALRAAEELAERTPERPRPPRGEADPTRIVLPTEAAVAAAHQETP